MPLKARETLQKRKNTPLGSTLSEKTKELEVLQRITESISSNLDLNQVLKEIVEMVFELTHADATLIYLLNDARDELILRASKNPHPKLIGRIRLEIGEGITGWVAKERRLVAISRDAEDDPRFKFFHRLPEDRYQAFLSVPVNRKGDVIGVLNIQYKESHEHSEGEIALLTTIGHQVGSAIDNARLYQEMKKKAMQLETLSRVSRTITSDRYIEEILNLIVTMTAGMMNSKICSIMILDEKKKALKIIATQSLSEEYRRKANVAVGESISGRVLKSRKSLAVLDVTRDPIYSFSELAKKEGFCSMLSVPMMIKKKAVGVINIYTSTEHSFSKEEIDLLQTVANQSAVAIENTTLSEQSTAMQEALGMRKAVERAKGLLMKQGKISEEEAFRLIRQQSMNTRKTMREISEAIIVASEISKF
ncbi:MAG: GAF and ANTAR domain-containing protein [Nitrospira sp.]|nr:GAF domain-containing protein [Candidatus Manganitrophaceae bacterium]HIL34220.1 GAF domain-containing protein [Candidatus Manganitrophaceae bacterium]